MASAKWVAQLQKRVLELLQLSGAAESPCPCCEGTKHEAQPLVTAPWMVPPGKGFNKDGLFLLPLICTACMHVRFFTAGGLAVLVKNKRQGETK